MSIEKILFDYFKNQEIPVFAEEPTEEIAEYFVIEKTGSNTENRINKASIAIQSYSDSMLGASELNERLKRFMDRITERNDVSSCRLNSDYNFTDTRKKKYRYQAIYDIVYFDFN